MQRKVLLIIPLIVILSLVAGGTALADQGDDPWAIGQADGSGSGPFDGSDEFPYVGQSGDDRPPNPFFMYRYNYRLDMNPDPVNAPSFPGYIGPQNVCDVTIVANNPLDTRDCVDTAQNVVIEFELTCDYPEGSYIPGDLQLVYSRYGSESDLLFLDGEFFAIVNPGAEFGWQEFVFDLGPQMAGTHHVEIKYAESATGMNNGHYIDQIRLDAQNGDCDTSFSCPDGTMPATLSFEANGDGSDLADGDTPAAGAWSNFGISDVSASSGTAMILDSSVGTYPAGFQTASENNVLVADADGSGPPATPTGDTISFTFSDPSMVYAFDVLDVDDDLSTYNVGSGDVSIPNGGDGSYQRVNVMASGVSTLDIDFDGDGAVGKVLYCAAEDPPDPMHWCIDVLKVYKGAGPQWDFSVWNCGATDLKNISVTDTAVTVSCPGPPFDLVSGARGTCTATGYPEELSVSFTSDE